MLQSLLRRYQEIYKAQTLSAPAATPSHAKRASRPPAARLLLGRLRRRRLRLLLLPPLLLLALPTALPRLPPIRRLLLFPLLLLLLVLLPISAARILLLVGLSQLYHNLPVSRDHLYPFFGAPELLLGQRVRHR